MGEVMDGGIRTRMRRHATGALIVAAATLIASAGNYALSIAAAHKLEPADFGAWGALVGTLAILGTIGLAAQAVVAREASADSSSGGHVGHGVGAWYRRLAPSTVILVLVLWIPLTMALSVSPLAMGLCLATVPVSVGTAIVIGLLQGSRDFTRLSWAILHAGLWRVILGIAALLLTDSLVGMTGGVLIGTVIGFVWCLYLSRAVSPQGTPGTLRMAPYLIALQALALMFAISNLDVLLARVVLSPTESGVYAVGSLVAKIAFFLPSPILIVLYPYMVRRADRLAVYLASSATLLVGAVVTAVCLVAPEAVVGAIAGDGLSEAGPLLWKFAIAGTLLALVQVTLYARLAVSDSAVLVLLWIGLGVLVAVVLLLPSPTTNAIVTVVIGVALALSLGGLWMDRRYTHGIAPPIEVAE